MEFVMLFKMVLFNIHIERKDMKRSFCFNKNAGPYDSVYPFYLFITVENGQWYASRIREYEYH